ncbi:MAG TPA: choice-of-anchor I family protein [Microbacterium sp.]|uniref:choice-of-anchor I family protein n=1 Tax=Microbacterium sp. TaxID=51671 RepID=UPI002C701B86|nr:choice-of-anchor I family protein [Microbacterium sp.]HWI30282.1 choice-of-anchor I family protein [Microbacterium sp.]
MPSQSPRRAVLAAAALAATCALVAAPLTAASAAIVADPITSSADDAALALAPIGTFESGLFDESGAEIVVAHGARLFVVNAQAGSVGVLDYSDPAAITEEFALTSAGVANSVAVRADGLGVIAFEAPVKTDPGHLVFFDANAADAASAYLGEVTVGALPDMVSISADGTYAVVANEGEPADDFSIDPEGSVSIVGLPKKAKLGKKPKVPTQADVRTADFHAFEGGALPEDVRVFGPTPHGDDLPVSRNLEPEYIVIDGGTAYAALQEANAFAVIDLDQALVTDILPLGFKDLGVPGNGIDGSDRDPNGSPSVNIQTYPGLFGVYMPDGLNSYQAGGETYLVSANEGDAREWGDYVEASRVKDLEDDGYGPVCDNLAAYEADAALGRLNVTRELGFDEAAGCYDELYAFGGRSFSIWTTAGEQVFDSGDAFERITAAANPAFFNSNHTESNLEGRSDDKGPEPESLAIGTLSGRTYAFIGFERVGGIAVFDITEPAASTFVTYINNRDFSVSVEDADDPLAVLSAAGDLGPEGLVFIPAEASATGAPLLAVANEVSGTTTLFSITDALALANVAAPVVSGSPDVGRTLTATPGEWSADGLTFAFQWLRDGSPIAGATKADYRVKTADQGHALSVRVTATGPTGAASADSDPVTARYLSAATATTGKVLVSTKDAVSVKVSVFPVSGPKATGSVTVEVAGKTLTGELSGGAVTVPVGTLPRGIHPIVVTYAGTETISPATGFGLVVVR